jgi:hypothetical protein
MFSRDRFSRLHDEATKRNNGLETDLPDSPLMDSRLAYTLVHLDIFSSGDRIQLLRRQFQDLLLPVLACYLRIDDRKGSLRADSLEAMG